MPEFLTRVPNAASLGREIQLSRRAASKPASGMGSTQIGASRNDAPGNALTQAEQLFVGPLPKATNSDGGHQPGEFSILSPSSSTPIFPRRTPS